jgi:hypothetical protein
MTRAPRDGDPAIGELLSDFAREVENTMGWDSGKGTWKAREEARAAVDAAVASLVERAERAESRLANARQEAIEGADALFRAAEVMAKLARELEMSSAALDNLEREGDLARDAETALRALALSTGSDTAASAAHKETSDADVP